MSKSRYFTGLQDDPEAFEDSITCHSGSNTLRLSAYFKVNSDPPSGKEGYIFHIDEVLDLKIVQGATAGTTKLVFFMDDSKVEDHELTMTIKKHTWILVVINIDGDDIYMSVKDDPSDYNA